MQPIRSMAFSVVSSLGPELVDGALAASAVAKAMAETLENTAN